MTLLTKTTEFLRLHLGWSSAESRGMLLLAPLAIGLAATPWIIDWQMGPRQLSEQEEVLLKKEIASIERDMALEEQRWQDSLQRAKAQRQEQWKQQREAQRTERPYQQGQQNAASGKTSYRPEPKIHLDINLATPEQLEAIRGIGPATAERIVKYRNLLGGSYHSLEQLQEVWGMRPEMLQALLACAYLAPQHVQRIDINHLDASALGRHPYIGYALAKRIVAYRTQHGPFGHLNDLLGIREVDTAAIRRVAPYLSFEARP